MCTETLTNFLKIAMDRTFLPGKNLDTISEKDFLHFVTFLEKAVFVAKFEQWPF